MKNPAHHWSLDQWLAWQEQLHPQSIELGLGRVQAVADRLGLRPARCPTVTVAGTNGKGSTARLIAQTLLHDGHRVGLYTSPHLLRYNERICIDGKPVTDQALCEAFAVIERARAGISLTYFEFGTLAALWLFARAELDFQVLEVGLGGRLDAVNLLDADCAVLTSIGLDHQDWLGDQLSQIAAEKLGVARAGRPLILGRTPAEAQVSAQAQARQVQRLQLGEHFRVDVQPDHWSYQDADLGCHWTALPWPQAGGVIQIDNAALALRASCALLGRTPARAAFEQALAESALPGRCERRGRYWLDVSHNAAAAEVLCRCLQANPIQGRRFLILGMLADKDAAAYLQVLAPAVDCVCCVGLGGPRGRSAEQLAAAIASVWHGPLRVRDSVPAAMADLRAEWVPEDEVIIAGSFHTVAAAGSELS